MITRPKKVASLLGEMEAGRADLRVGKAGLVNLLE